MTHNTLQYFTLVIAWLIGANAVHAQLSLDSCVAKARANYPTIQQLNLIEKSEELALSNANKNYLPLVSLNAQATHQSDVTRLPVSIPNLDVPTVSENQYRVYGELVQPLTDLLVIKHHKELIHTEKEVRTQQVNVAMRNVNLQVTRLYFNILMLNAQLNRVHTVIQDLESGLRLVKAAIEQGVSYPADQYALEAELLSVKQTRSQLQCDQNTAIQLLSQFIGETIDPNVVLPFPAANSISLDNRRSELALLDAQREQLLYQSKLVDASTLPKIFLFGQSGYGRPALNMLNNEVDFYYIAGIKMNWNISSFYTAANNKEQIAFKGKQLEVERKTFLFNHQAESTRILSAIDRVDALILDDEQIIALQSQIVEASKSQLENGTITSTEYIHRVNAENRARINLETHKISSLLLQYEYYNLLNP